MLLRGETHAGRRTSPGCFSWISGFPCLILRSQQKKKAKAVKSFAPTRSIFIRISVHILSLQYDEQGLGLPLEQKCLPSCALLYFCLRFAFPNPPWVSQLSDTAFLPHGAAAGNKVLPHLAEVQESGPVIKPQLSNTSAASDGPLPLGQMC